jgi:hypothetical protein
MRQLVRTAVLGLFVAAVIWGPQKVIESAATALTAARRIAASAPDATALIALLVAVSLGFTLGRFRTHYFQNRSEARVSRALRERYASPDYHLLSHVTLPIKNGTTQIDHILVSRFGVFVIEAKDYRGWIFGNRDDRYWTQVLFRTKFRFQNPIRQNFLHARAVRELLDFLPAGVIRPVVLFTGTAEFRTPLPDGVFSLEGFQIYVESHALEVMSLNRVQFCVGRLETIRLSITKQTDLEHVQRLRRRYGSNE